MPATGKLPDAVIADLEKWIALGAPDPRTSATTGKALNLEEARKFLVIPTTRRPAVPETETRSTLHPWRSWDENGTEAKPAADRARHPPCLFDLIGLPPSPGKSTHSPTTPTRTLMPS